jgi:hypothetical protein
VFLVATVENPIPVESSTGGRNFYVKPIGATSQSLALALTSSSRLATA